MRLPSRAGHLASPRPGKRLQQWRDDGRPARARHLV